MKTTKDSKEGNSFVNVFLYSPTDQTFANESLTVFCHEKEVQSVRKKLLDEIRQCLRKKGLLANREISLAEKH